ncbi:MAG: DUF1080 domain-containing protein [Planctomycetota bacterium]|nr:DUF1080 domain-containing protein [Planctomycetota bacterium]
MASLHTLCRDRQPVAGVAGPWLRAGIIYSILALVLMAPDGPVVAAEAGWARRLVRNLLPGRQLVERRGGLARLLRGFTRRRAVAATAPAWRPLFDGNTLMGWQPTRFGGEGEVAVADGRIEMAFGYSLTGITYQDVFPKLDYELELEAIKIDGNDFFCGLTFPVKQSYCSLIVGGWGGAVVGISSIDGKDASQNDTTRYMRFEHGQWYRIRLRVTASRLRAWIDEQLVVDQPIQGRRITTRSEVNLSQPFGICAYETRAAFRKIRVRHLNPTEIREPEGASASGL